MKHTVEDQRKELAPEAVSPLPAVRLGQIEPLLPEQPVDPHQILEQHLAVAIDDRQALPGGEGQPASHVPAHHPLFLHGRADDARGSGRQLSHDIRGRVAAAGDVVADEHELVVLDARVDQDLADARRQSPRLTAGAVTQDDDGEIRPHGVVSDHRRSNSARCRGVSGRRRTRSSGR